MSITRRFPRCAVGLVLALGLLTYPVLAGTGDLVSANPHLGTLPSGSTPPLASIASLSNVDINAYHVSELADVTRALGYNSYSKPKILSDDAGGITLAQTKDWISRACAAGQHYEHFDQPLGTNAQTGVVIDTKSDFPLASQKVLEYIRDQSCASDLAAWGTLTRVGGELRWNNQKVQLVGHSWMGALAGKNFNIPAYLQVLANHRVNLTRVWVIEQWTGMLVLKAGAPHPSNAVMPFTGAIDFNGSNDTLDIGQINQQFLLRLRQFVDEAAARGIVVQLTLFDRHGLINNAGDYGRWLSSPYSVANNANLVTNGGTAGKAAPNFIHLCTPQSLVALGSVSASSLQGPMTSEQTVLDLSCYMENYNRYLIEEIVSELSYAGNVIYEIMNEPLAAEWGEIPLRDWHSWVAGIVKSTN